MVIAVGAGEGVGKDATFDEIKLIGGSRGRVCALRASPGVTKRGQRQFNEAPTALRAVPHHARKCFDSFNPWRW
jgi:hypothetical protein